MLDSLNPLSEDAEHKSAIDKSWKEGVDYFRVEPTLICHDGESVQVRRSGSGEIELAGDKFGWGQISGVNHYSGEIGAGRDLRTIMG